MSDAPTGYYEIAVTGIAATGCHGVYPHEKSEPQPFTVDVTLEVFRLDAADVLGATFDYSSVAASVRQIVKKHSFNLIETLAGRIANEFLAVDSVRAVNVRVHKPQAGSAGEDVSVALRVAK
ncbi:MAG: dihydroneopterin aldolase [Propionibacteriaceae bacterium]|jgi:dihydroneopterin aldolase|nr:dihydroneopterin aldolase [Propionibacteriaceae bacterium]